MNIKQKRNDWFEKDLKNLETKFKNLDMEFEFEKAIDLFKSTPKSELVNYYLELLYLFKTTRENKGK